MKTMNKKGFTLAELLIVIAIIAVLIAIAIPTFSGALDNARRQTDHANIRAAYSVMQVAKLTGEIDGVKPAASGTVTTWVMQKDGSFLQSGDKPYVTKADGNATCADCAGCPGGATGDAHDSGKTITIVYTPGSGTTAGTWNIVLGTASTPASSS